MIPEFSKRMQKIDPRPLKDMFAYGVDPEIISFACGNPDPSLFPNKELSEIAARVLLTKPVQALQYGKTNGYGPFMETLRLRLKAVEKIDCSLDQLLITTGAQQGMEMIAKLLINEGDTVIVDEPCFIGSMNAFRSYGANLVGVPLEDDGMNLNALEAALKAHPDTKFIYTIPCSSNPMGTTMSEEKRRSFYEIVKRFGVLVLEDNPYGELIFDGEKPTAIKSLDTENLVLYCGSFSKILSPGLRLGYVCADAAIIDALSTVKQTADLQTALLPQLMADEYLHTYDINAHIRTLCDCYKAKSELMLEQLETHFPDGVYYTRPKGGLFLWCDLNRNVDTNEIINRCLKEKVAYVPGYAFMVDINKPYSTMRLNFSAVSPDEIRIGMARLGRILKEEVK